MDLLQMADKCGRQRRESSCFGTSLVASEDFENLRPFVPFGEQGGNL